jgi:hypothetical protein
MPYRFFGRTNELTLLDESLHGGPASVVGFLGLGGQGKTAIVQHWLETISAQVSPPEGVFLWSFYRGKDPDLCLRALYAYATGQTLATDLSASYYVDHVLPLLRRERWALVLDGTEVVQYDQGPWFGRFVHPELGRLLEEAAGDPMPGVVVLTSRFPLPELERRHHTRLVSLGGLDSASARKLLLSVGVQGTLANLEAAAGAAGYHAKAVELLGTWLAYFHGGQAEAHLRLPAPPAMAGASDEEHKVACVLAAYQGSLALEALDVLALATAFRDPPREARLLEYLACAPVQTLLHQTWGRAYAPFATRSAGWLAAQVDLLVRLRLLERVGRGPGDQEIVLDAHPLVRRGFGHVLGPEQHRLSSQARAGFLRGRPDRRRPDTLADAREEIELFHAHCDAGLWHEADNTYVALDNPKHRFLAPALERDLLLRFFPDGDWRRPPFWSGFGRYRSLAISFELLGQFAEALTAYRDRDAALRGDALLALGHLGPMLDTPQVAPAWNPLWQAYRSHALCLAARTDEALALARSLVPVDVYEWLHVFECYVRTGQLGSIDLRSVLYQPPHIHEHRWSELARQRMRADYLRLQSPAAFEVQAIYESLIEAYDRGGLPYERALTRLGYGRWLLARGDAARTHALNTVALELAERFDMPIVAADAWTLAADLAQQRRATSEATRATEQATKWRHMAGYRGPARP